MSIYAISDLHLSFGHNKPMEIFGSNWENHSEKIKEAWMEKVKEEDLVILPGDFSWALYLKETFKDFEYLNSLPGKKLLVKGNHDYWWTTLTKMRTYLKENNFNNIDFIYNNSYFYDNKIIAGTRGWMFSDKKEDKKIVKREILRLELSINTGIKQFGKDKEIIVCMHYPPFECCNGCSRIGMNFIKVMKQYNNIKTCVYGHLHGELAYKEGKIKKTNGINLILVSCDYTGFNLVKV